MTVWFLSDTHFGHTKAAGHREFLNNGEPNTAAHDAHIIARYREHVLPRDTVWWLGDIAVTSSPVKLRAILALIAELPGTKHLIAGNHDACWPGNRQSYLWQRTYLSAFDSVQAFARRKLPLNTGTVPLLLSHFPYHAEHVTNVDDQVLDPATTDRPRENYRLRDNGLRLLHGHLHNHQKITSRYETPDGSAGPVKEVHAGLDAWGLAPVSWDQIIATFEKGE